MSRETPLGMRKALLRAWVTFTDNGVAASVRDSYGVSSVTRDAAGDFTVTWSRPFGYVAGATGYAVVGSCRVNASIGALQLHPVDGASGMYTNGFVKVRTGAVGGAASQADLAMVGAWGP
jgi:hypothetical protein